MEGFNRKAFDEMVGKAQEEALKDNAKLDSANALIKEIKGEKEIAESKEQFETWQTIESGGKSKDELIKELEEKGRLIGADANHLLKSEDFKTSESREHIDLVRPTVKDLGFDNGATTEEIYARADELGLDLCEAEDAPNLRVQYDGTEGMAIAMKQITGSGGFPSVFYLSSDDDDLWLGTNGARPGIRWNADNRFVFRRRK
ncbi:hypothetical protein A2524_01085 [Candidatus Wolfebacteria bacterium RIFOXYD12_FULL_48_21]|uniref:Uncharacterized protein n=1 Tax=Candidatus Wolfebacteria bacterium RIFOXYD1_FULL_48_65 TaxID=1802561 RepID=A0A1F8E0J7_9BACT|nr:MAG: hypothetical protein A2610_03030 [Candidatus Wolfebacteria bacterium RIFOXYD1_FULL_48_65]OGM94403.1 MAG: hypothetical protein A2524_01085 [Candidatus Wolfebacteria bacterium RIFOXYD12_FULL_48_21]